MDSKRLTEVVKIFFNYAFKYIDFSYDGLTRTEKTFLSRDEFDELIKWKNSVEGAMEVETDDKVPGGPDEIGSDRWFIAQAKGDFEDEGTLEIDEGAPISRGGNNGAYVQAWVWVPLPDEEDE